MLIGWVETPARGARSFGLGTPGTLGRVEDCVDAKMPKSIPPSEDVEAIRAGIRQQCEGQIGAVRGAARNALKNANLVKDAAMHSLDAIKITVDAINAEISANLCSAAQADLADAGKDLQNVQADIQTLLDIQVEVDNEMLPQSFFDSEVRSISVAIGQSINALDAGLNAVNLEAVEERVKLCVPPPGPGPGPVPPPPPPPTAAKGKSKAGVFLLGAAALAGLYFAVKGGAGGLPV